MKNGEKISVLMNVCGAEEMFIRFFSTKHHEAINIHLEPKEARQLSRALHVYADIYEQLKREDWPEEKSASIEIKGEK